MSEKLLPCPFCGGKAHFAVSSDGYAVECDGELCVRNAMQEHPSEEYAALWWNTRAQGTCRVEYVWDMTDEYEYAPHVYYMVGLTCGHSFEQGDSEPPNFCPECGRRVEA